MTSRARSDCATDGESWTMMTSWTPCRDNHDDNTGGWIRALLAHAATKVLLTVSPSRRRRERNNPCKESGDNRLVKMECCVEKWTNGVSLAVLRWKWYNVPVAASCTELEMNEGIDVKGTTKITTKTHMNNDVRAKSRRAEELDCNWFAGCCAADCRWLKGSIGFNIVE